MAAFIPFAHYFPCRPAKLIEKLAVYATVAPVAQNVHHFCRCRSQFGEQIPFHMKQVASPLIIHEYKHRMSPGGSDGHGRFRHESGKSGNVTRFQETQHHLRREVDEPLNPIDFRDRYVKGQPIILAQEQPPRVVHREPALSQSLL